MRWADPRARQAPVAPSQDADPQTHYLPQHCSAQEESPRACVTPPTDDAAEPTKGAGEPEKTADARAR